MDIVVTTPKSEIENSRKEAEECIRAGGGFYFRKLNKMPKNLNKGDKCFYVEDGFVTGFCVVFDIITGRRACELTGRDWGEGIYLLMDAKSWNWIKPIPQKGFQGWRYFSLPFEIVGDWRDKKP